MYAVLMPLPLSVAANTPAMAASVPRTTRRSTLTTRRFTYRLTTWPSSSPPPGPTAAAHGGPCVRVPEHAPEGRHVAGQPIHAHQDRQAAAQDRTSCTSVVIKTRSRCGLTTPPSHSRDGTASAMRHPHPAAHQLHPQLVGLDVLQVHLAVLDHVLMHPLAVLAGTGQPGGHGALIQAEGGDDGLDRTAVAQQGQHHVSPRPPPLQAVEGRALGGREGLATGGAADSAGPLGYARECSLPLLASGRAVLIVAELGLRVHRWPPLDAFLLSQANHVPKDARRTRFFQTMQPLTTVNCGGTD